MTGRLTVVAVFLCFGSLFTLAPLVDGTELEEFRLTALKKLHDQSHNIDVLKCKVNDGSQQNLLVGVTDTRINHGKILAERIHFEIGQVADGYILIAELLNATKEVKECMSDRMEYARNETEKYFIDKFFRVVQDFMFECSGQQHDKFFEWINEKHGKYSDYKNKYDGVRDKIKSASDQTEISAVFNSLYPMGEEVIAEMKENIDAIKAIQKSALVFSDEKLQVFRKFMRDTVDKTAENIEDCFFITSDYYADIKTILNTIM